MNSSFQKIDQDLKNKIIRSTQIFAVLSITFLIFLLLFSGAEVLLSIVQHSLENDILELWGWSNLNDLKFWFAILLPAYLIFLPFHIVSSKITELIFKIGFIVFFTIQLMLVYYHTETLTMLGSDLFGYSLKEIRQTVGSSGILSFKTVFLFIVFTGILAFSIFFLSKKLRTNRILAFSLPVLSLILILSGFTARTLNQDISGEFNRSLIKNKSRHFYLSAYSYFNPEIYEPDIYAESYLGEYLSKYAEAEPLEYVDEFNYPFLKKELNRDVLSPFFETSENQPHVVFIIVEGLGRAFSNRGAYLGNFTPFLDSLSTQSLYWPNFLSNGGRTFAVIPSIFGSLPFARTGFMELDREMPAQLSLLNLLGKNGYQTNFYYGGNSEFDNMAMYLRENKIDRIVDEKDFPDKYQKIPASASGFTWGYGDKELFRYYLESIREQNGKPGLDVLLTVSMHNPFLIDETEKFNQVFEKKLEEYGFSEEKKKNYRNYRKQYRSILYTDEALKNLIADYKKRPDYKNTIFIITGDHRIPEIPMASKIDRYHVPFIIFSPLLKRTAEFEAVSSHFDVAPSLLSFMKHNYGVKAPAVNSFVGRGLDTTRSFQNMHSIPLKQTKTNLIDFVQGEYHLNGEELFKLNSNFREEAIEDNVKKQELQNAFNQFRRKNAEIIKGKKIIPDSIAQKYVK